MYVQHVLPWKSKSWVAPRHLREQKEAGGETTDMDSGSNSNENNESPPNEQGLEERV